MSALTNTIASGSADASADASAGASASTPHSSDAIYDRQLRLWGAAAQATIMTSKILFVHPTPLLSEVIKNLVLAGLSGTLLSDRNVQSHDVQPMLFVDAGMIGTNVATAMLSNVQELNPLATLVADTRPLSTLGAKDLAAYNVIVADPTHMSKSEIYELNKSSRVNGSKLYERAPSEARRKSAGGDNRLA